MLSPDEFADDEEMDGTEGAEVNAEFVDLAFAIGADLYFPELPESLHSCFAEGLFTHCIECGIELQESGLNYLIQKARRHGETLLEMAICQPCSGLVQGKVSEESREVLEEFVGELSLRAGEVEEGRCLSCLKEIPADAEFEIAALARGRYLVAPALIICASCHEALEEKLSEETKRGGQEFIEKNFPGVPADLGLPFSFVGG